MNDDLILKMLRLAFIKTNGNTTCGTIISETEIGLDNERLRNLGDGMARSGLIINAAKLADGYKLTLTDAGIRKLKAMVK